MKEVVIENKENGYKIYLHKNLDNFTYIMNKSEISDEDKIFIITDSNLYNLYADSITNLKKTFKAEVFFFKAGEENKNNLTINEIYEFLIEHDANRQSVLIAFGGGVVGDLVGYVAATYMRGIRFINIPTTVISQVDSSVGGKVGYNYKKMKNIIGAFHNPTFVYICTDFLKTLSNEQYIEGFGEIIKYGLIENREFLKFIENNYKEILMHNSETLLYIIENCINFKANIVNIDFKDTGLRNVLNFGHTIGHGIEYLSNNTVSHGNAVALGILAAIKISEQILGLSKEVYKCLLEIYHKLGLPTKYNIDNYEMFLYAINHDKKNTKDINFVLLEDIGKCKIKVSLTNDDIIRGLRGSIDK